MQIFGDTFSKYLERCVMLSPLNRATEPCILLVEDSFIHADVMEGCLRLLSISILGPYPSVQDALDMLRWTKADAVIFNASLADPTAAETLATFLDDSGIPSLMVNWSPLPATSPLRYGRQELLWPLAEGELIRAVGRLLDRGSGMTWAAESTR